MKHKGEPSSSAEKAIDLTSAVKELHGISSQELNKLLRDSENFTIHRLTEKGSSIKINMEKLASWLPLHLVAVLMSSDKDEALFRYLLSGIRLLHSLCDLASRHTKLEQILLDDVKVSEQLLDLVFYLLIVLGGYRQGNHNTSLVPLLHSTLVACSLHLLTGFISSQWQDLVQVLVAHPKVDIFMDVAFGATHKVVRFLQIKLSAKHTDVCPNSGPSAEQILNHLCQQCEASLQFLQSLCQQKMFRERVLRNKELCGKGGVLFVAKSILKLNIAPHFLESSTVVAAVSRLKAKVLSILLHLCEAESISYLDEVASSPDSLHLAKSVALEVLEILKTGLRNDTKHLSAHSGRIYPMGLLQLNAMRLADIFSDDSNFRSYITEYFTEVLSAIFSLSHGDFLSILCSSDLPIKEEDATLEYDSFAAAGWVLDSFSMPVLLNATNSEFNLAPINMPKASYAHQRTSLFVKVIANLHCFIPTICEEQERNLFLNKFLACLQMDPSKSLPGFSFTSGAEKATTVCKNLRQLLSHAESLIPNFLNEEDLLLLRVFFDQLNSLINPTEPAENQAQEAQIAGGCPSPVLSKKPPNFNNRSGNQKEETPENSAFQEENQVHVRSSQNDQGDDATRQGNREDKDKSGTSGGLREIDRDVQNVESSGSDTSPTRGKKSVELMDNAEFPKSNKHLKESGFGGVQGDEKVETVQGEEKQRKKRKRTIMNEKQMSLIETALLDEPDMQRNTASIQSWADKLSLHGSEVTSSQLRNWLNNRKARLARAGKDVRAPLEVDNTVPGKQGGSGSGQLDDTPDSPGEDIVPSNARGTRSMLRTATSENAEAALVESADNDAAEFIPCKPGQYVVIVDGQGEEIANGKVHQVQGKWYGKSLEESETCVVDVVELKTERLVQLPYPTEATGTTFDEAETKLGLMRVMWDSNKIYMLRPQ